MTEQGTTAKNETVSCSYRPSAFGAPRAFSLSDRSIDWIVGGRSGSIPFDRIRRVRVSFRPNNMQSYRFVTELWADGYPKLQIASTSCKSMFEQERFDGAYSGFVSELHRRIANANGLAQFDRGSSPLIYWPGVIIFVGAGFGLAALIARALQAGAMTSAAIVAAFLALYLWQAGNFFRRNRPGTYRPEALPADIMPRQ
jgi:hypothetical protein